MTQTVSLINNKGGTGKSTVAVNLAWHFAAYNNWGKKVLVVDLDPQVNASLYLLGVHKYANIINDKKPAVREIFEQLMGIPGKTRKIISGESVRSVARIRHGGKIDLIPSRPDLDLSLSLRNPGQKEYLLQKTLSEIKDGYDLILIDCAPTESVLTTAAYLASNYVLVPVRPEYLSTVVLSLLVNSMRNFHEQYKDHVAELCGIVFNAVTGTPEEKKSKTEVGKLADKNGWHVFSSEIPYSRYYPKGAREGQPIFRTSYAHTDQAAKFSVFAEEFAERIGLSPRR